MSNPTDNITMFPKPSRLSLSGFIMQTKKYCAELASTQSSVLSAQELFSEGGDIWPDQCDGIIHSIHTMSEPVQKFCELLDSFAHLPIAAGSLRYPLIRTLHSIDELLSDLTLLITLFRTNCRTPSKQAIVRRQEIQRKLELLVQSIEEIGHNIDTLPERILYEEKVLGKI
ncbi:MAG TPA: hypothetical protein DEV72_03680 [Ktedonobacter sp.]|jgi:hypothetical protein|nr:hypothetical protein [Ktedonobacter sp.]HCF84286.1 hypothetical protein [Ktedonobacter sp.]HCP75155.1 hypothetical protein [Ktedonobacter sp.]